MPASERVRVAYNRIEPVLRDFQTYVRRTLRPFCDEHRYGFFDRVKSLDSLAEKLDGGRYDSWEKIDDLYACTVVVPSETHEAAVRAKLAQSFHELRVRDRDSTKKAPDVFRFDGLRWYGTASEPVAQLKQPGFGKIPFEVQVLTAFEHAWVLVTHDLVYKTDDVTWGRYRLAAQLKAAVEQIEIMISAFESASMAVRQSPWPEIQVIAEVSDRFKALATEGLIPETLIPSNWRRFAENVVALVKSYDRNPNKLQKNIHEVLLEAEKELRQRSTPLPFTGTLFHFVISLVARIRSVDALSKQVIVYSPELNTFYGLTDVPNQFRFDETALDNL